MDHIVAATDLSRRGKIAIERAYAIARATGAKLTLVHAVDDDQPLDMAAEAVEHAGAHLLEERTYRSDGVEIGQAVVTGDKFSALLAEVDALEGSLIVVGDHRRSVIRDIFTDTTVERLARLADIPILVARIGADRSYQKALIGVEEGEGVALVAALDLLGPAAPTSNTLLHSVDPLAGLMAYAGIPPENIDTHRRRTKEIAKKRLAKTLSEEVRRRVAIRIEDFEPAIALSRISDDEDFDLVVVSTHGRRGLRRAFLGSVSASLIRHGRKDLLIVPAALGLEE